MEANDRIYGVSEAPAAGRRLNVAGREDEADAKPAAPVPDASGFEPIRRNFQARLSYDPVEADVFIEILDPRTGDVIRRLPAESEDDDPSNRHLGTLVDRIA